MNQPASLPGQSVDTLARVVLAIGAMDSGPHPGQPGFA
jgi:hypothetical protein